MVRRKSKPNDSTSCRRSEKETFATSPRASRAKSRAGFAKQGSVPLGRRQSQPVTRQRLDVQLGARAAGQLLSESSHDCTRNPASTAVLLQVGETGPRIGDAEVARTLHRGQRRLRKPFGPKKRRHAPRLARDLFRVAVVQRERHEAEASMTNGNVEAEVE